MNNHTILYGKFILTWDDMADTKTRYPFVGNINDFEGYKVYRSTDKYMSDPEIITDGYGTPMFKKPIYQCDLVDGISGFTDFGLVNGAGYNLGSETCLLYTSPSPRDVEESRMPSSA